MRLEALGMQQTLPSPLGAAMDSTYGGDGNMVSEQEASASRLSAGMARWQKSSSGAEEAALLAAQLLWSRQVMPLHWCLPHRDFQGMTNRSAA